MKSCNPITENSYVRCIDDTGTGLRLTKGNIYKVETLVGLYHVILHSFSGSETWHISRFEGLGMAPLPKVNVKTLPQIEPDYKVILNENVAPFDVDWTLIEECSEADAEHSLIDPRTGEKYFYQIHKEHVSLLKQMKARGRYIIVWSASGHWWADTICKSIGIKPFVDLVMTKPNCYIDDKVITSWCNQVYLERKDKKK